MPARDRAPRHAAPEEPVTAQPVDAVPDIAYGEGAMTGLGDEVTSSKGTLRGGLWNAAATVLPMGSTLALSIVISRELGAAVLGEQSVIAYVASLLVSVLIFSFTNASIQLLATAVGSRDDDRLAWLARWSASAHLSGGILAAAVMTGIGIVRDDYKLLWFLAAATALADALGWSRTVRDIAHRGWTRTSRRRLIAQAAAPLMSIAAIYAGWGIEGVFAAQLSVAVALLVALALLDRSLPRPPRRPSGRPAWRPVARTWLMFSGSLLIGQIIQRRIELVFLDRYHDGPTVAMFSVAANVITIPVVLTSTLIGASLPAIAARYVQDPGAVAAVMGRTARVVCTLGVLLSAATFAVGPGLVRTAYGPEFTEAAEVVRYLALMLLVVPVGQVCTTLWTGIGRLAPVLWCGASLRSPTSGSPWPSSRPSRSPGRLRRPSPRRPSGQCSSWPTRSARASRCGCPPGACWPPWRSASRPQPPRCWCASRSTGCSVTCAPAPRSSSSPRWAYGWRACSPPTTSTGSPTPCPGPPAAPSAFSRHDPPDPRSRPAHRPRRRHPRLRRHRALRGRGGRHPGRQGPPGGGRGRRARPHEAAPPPRSTGCPETPRGQL
ncbi:lipopolysaccharide biosynthesis protein [Klenkia terrae]|uniref:lipopolysaccharide biosynthesis protein n=1 Tax=Klenkia terrae TaxID=1052259 RepID=UPI003607EB04